MGLVLDRTDLPCVPASLYLALSEAKALMGNRPGIILVRCLWRGIEAILAVRRSYRLRIDFSRVAGRSGVLAASASGAVFRDRRAVNTWASVAVVKPVEREEAIRDLLR